MDNVALSFSKLADPNKQRSNENLSLKQLTVLANDSGDLELSQALKEKFEELLQSCEKFRKLRNKRIAHADLDHAMGGGQRTASWNFTSICRKCVGFAARLYEYL